MLRFDSVSPRLTVPELRTTLKFYSDVLGFDDWSGWPEEMPTFAIVARDGVALQFQQGDADSPLTTTTTLHFTVGEVRAVLNQIGEQVPIEWGPEVYSYGRREFAVRDCNGALLIFSEITSDPPTCSDQ